MEPALKLTPYKTVYLERKSFGCLAAYPDKAKHPCLKTQQSIGRFRFTLSKKLAQPDFFHSSLYHLLLRWYLKTLCTGIIQALFSA